MIILTGRWFLQQKLRLYFPSFQATQIVCGVHTSYAQEIKKFRQWGLAHITPHLRRSKFTKYPYKLTVIFYSFSDQDAISTLTITAYLTHLLESNAVLQSTDYRVIPSIEVKMQKVNNIQDEGCEIIIEPFKD